jgi:acyl-CoA synthetase (AMP-forming)/AMP-acid ligase II
MSSESAVLRLQQTTHHITNTPPKDFHNLSIVHGPSEPALVSITLGELLDEQCLIRPNKECIVIPWTGARWTFQDLQVQSKKLARAMLSLGVQAGDRVGILSGNCEEYAAVFFAAGYVGAILVVLNSTYTASEARYALNHSGKFIKK